MDIRSFFAKKASSGGASTKATVDTTTATTTTTTTTTASATTALTSKEGAVVEKQRTTANMTATPKKRKEEDATIVMTGLGSSDDDDNIVLRPSPKKKLKQPPEQGATSPHTPATTVNRRTSSPSRSVTKHVVQEKPSKSPPTPTSAAKTPPVTRSPRKAKASPTPEKTPLLDPIEERDSYDLKTDNIVPECLQGLTFCLTGVMEELNRIDITDLLKSLGAKVTNAVSGRTSYLVVGPLLEDGRPSETSLKYREAVEKGTCMITNIRQLYGLCHQYQERAMVKQAGMTNSSLTTKQTPLAVEPPSSKAVPTKTNPYAKKPMVNPYANKASAGGTATAPPPTATTSSSNPYAKKANPYHKEGGGGSSSTATPSNSVPSASRPSSYKPGELWVDRHAPKSTRDILGNTENVNKLRIWLNNWERTFNKPEAYGKSFSAPKGPWKAALLSGPPGIGSKWTERNAGIPFVFKP
jgi:replication factor C subunit 1